MVLALKGVYERYQMLGKQWQAWFKNNGNDIFSFHLFTAGTLLNNLSKCLQNMMSHIKPSIEKHQNHATRHSAKLRQMHG
jgi:hypothetical protein